MIRPEAFRDAAGRAESVSVADLLELHGRASWPALLLVLALLSTLPIAGVGTVLSLPLFLVAARWPQGAPGAGARGRVALPPQVMAFRLGETWSRRCLGLLATLYERARLTLRRRWLSWRHPSTHAGWRLWIAAMALLILLPLPLGNLLPGISLVLLSLGWIYRDGVALLWSMLAGAAAMAYGVLSAHVLWAMAQAAWQWWAA
ncbi:exopolysaccharide biosynthesis protein [Ideonella sp. DXS29W]|uniref:Exopolysaccharide biosynthesis protein n=1 Tax=Ideonella lacteola TaxID=2984193 RepID=A0ABU9BM80_9BURK